MIPQDQDPTDVAMHDMIIAIRHLDDAVDNTSNPHRAWQLRERLRELVRLVLETEDHAMRRIETLEGRTE